MSSSVVELTDAHPPVSDVVSIPNGTNVLVSGPVMTGKRRVMNSLLASGDAADRGTTVVTTRKPGDAVEREIRSLAPVPEEMLTIVDCVSRSGNLGRVVSSGTRRYISDPGDLTGIGIALTEFMRRFYERNCDARVGLHVLSTLVMYVDFKRVFQFLHVVTGRIAASGFSGVFTLDEGIVSDREESVLFQPFDAVLQLRERETPEIRVRGDDFGPRRWTPVSLDAPRQ